MKHEVILFLLTFVHNCIYQLFHVKLFIKSYPLCGYTVNKNMKRSSLSILEFYDVSVSEGNVFTLAADTIFLLTDKVSRET